MVFSSTTFVFLFLPITLVLAWLVPKRAKNYVLLVASLIFYAWGEPLYILLLLLNSFFNYGFAFVIRRKGMLTLSVILNIGLLGVFKYAAFFVGTLNSVLGLSLAIPAIPLPIGISFYTFQAMSYVIDVYRGTVDVQRRYDRFLLYLVFFPQLIAGPIVKYRDIAEQLDHREVTFEKTALGVSRFVMGLAKKLLLANSMAVVVDRLFDVEPFSFFGSWLVAIAYVFQIYFDFSGYSDMAIGLGMMFGFHFKENFNKPLSATSLNDYWRRWHISLTTWFREYVYFPLGGNRKGKWKTLRNQFIVFFLSGLWHGAAWNFVLWGLWHGFFMMLEKRLLQSREWPKMFGRIYMWLVVVFGLVMFRAPTLATALEHMKTMLMPWRSSLSVAAVAQEVVTPLFWVMFFMCVLTSTRLSRRVRVNEKLKWGWVAFVWLCCIMTLSASTYNPFIYFRF